MTKISKMHTKEDLRMFLQENNGNDKMLKINAQQLWQSLVESYQTNAILVDNCINEIYNCLTRKQLYIFMNKQPSLLPVDVTGWFKNLVRIDLSNSYLKDLPNSLYLLENLQYLVLSNNQLSYLPNVITHMKKLKSLDVCMNYLKELPKDMEKLTELEHLDLSANKLSSLPLTCKELNHLKSLSIENNNFQSIPDCIGVGLCSLQSLNISQNIGINLELPPCSVKLQKFYAAENGVCPSIPKWIFTSKYQLEEVSLNKSVFNKFDLPNESSNLSIKRLSMMECKLSEQLLERIIKRLICLESLIVGNTHTCVTFYDNSFWHLPIERIKDPTFLKELFVVAANVSSLPIYINKFMNLSVIDVSYNNITWLPDEICSLKNLEKLLISNNLLAILPKNFGELTSLRELKVSHNVLSCLPDSMVRLYNLKLLDLYDNELYALPEAFDSMKNLLGLDLEQNYFSTNDLSIKKADYEHLRFILRSHWREEDVTPIGPKRKVTYYSEDSDNNGNLAESWNDKESDDSSIRSINEIKYENENWDISDDSADEFDPTEYRELNAGKRSPFFLYKMAKERFCPADLHPIRTAERVRKILQEGRIVWQTEFEEEQFEDA